MKYHKQAIILHIPHSSTYIPDHSHFTSKNLVKQEINLLTDWATEKLYDLPEIDKIVVPFSRVFCDVERLPDADEPMYQKGAGFFYTQTDDEQILRTENAEFKQQVWKNYHQKHHQKLHQLVKQKLKKFGHVLIIDCHSFSSKPLKRESNQSLDRPDICIGTDNFHTPKLLKQLMIKNFSKFGYEVKENMPYSGTIVPLAYYKREKSIHSLMIEINKKLYMDEISFNVNKKNVKDINNHLEKIILSLLQFVCD